MNGRYILPVLFVFLGLWGCSGQPKSTNKPKDITRNQRRLPDFSSINTSNVFAYSCGDSLQFSAHVTKDSTWLFLPDTTLKTLAVEAGSGAKYEGARYIYWSKGNKAILQRPRGSLMICKMIPKQKAWAAARIRGVDFRALGQEPGWILEITRDKQISYIGNYGRDTLNTTVPKAEKNDNQITYNVHANTHNLKVAIKDKPCNDSMSGFRFPKSVTVTLDGNTYHGCGRSLN